MRKCDSEKTNVRTKTRAYASLPDVTFINRKWSWNCAQLTGVRSPPCKRPLINIIIIKEHTPISKFLCLRMTSTKKKNLTESEIEVLLAEVEVRAGTLFGSLSSSSSSTYCHCVHNEIPLVTTPRCIKN